MRFSVFLLMHVCTIVISDKEAEQERNRKKIIEQLTKTRTVLLDDYDLVTRQIATDVYMYRSYRTVSVVFYPIMRDVTDARFAFQSEELHTNNIGSCSPQDVIINIKHNSYPAVNPDGYDFPKHFIKEASRENIHSIELQSDGKYKNYSIPNPKPGNWYAIVYIKWQDPRTQKVEQQGLVADCQTILYTDLQVKREKNIKLIDCYTGFTVDYAEVPAYFKCMAIDSIESISLNVTITNTSLAKNELSFIVQSSSIPSEKSNLLHCAFDPRLNNVQTITFAPQPNAWHYIKIYDVKGNVSSIADCESYLSSDVESIDNHTVTELMRDDKGRFFSFEYGLPTTDIQDATSLINITSGEVRTLRFKVNQVMDIGGSVTIEASLLMGLKYYMGYRRAYQKGSLLAFTEDNQFFKAVICMDIGHASVPQENGRCKYNDIEKQALFVLNSTDSESIYDKVIIPYPEGGLWYLTLRLFCDDVVCPCRTSDNGTKYYVNTDALDKDGEVNSSVSWSSMRHGTGECNSTVVLSISSSACVSGQCSNHGRCMLNTFGGLVMSFCTCTAGYGSWDCSDNSRMDSILQMMVTVLLLTLSNLLFVLSIYVAVIRLYYTEAMMYLFAMFLSTFYHACDAPLPVAYCMFERSILQFGDFYCGLMSFWVTLLAMSVIGDGAKSSLQLVGAIGVALLTTWDMYSFVAFLLPVAVGITILLVSWLWDYRKNHSMRYPRIYYIRYLPLGLVLVSVGLICYAFLQTEQNYRVVHSMWHMVVAVSVIFLLPDVKREMDAHPFRPSPDYCNLLFCKFFQRSQTPIAIE